MKKKQFTWTLNRDADPPCLICEDGTGYPKKFFDRTELPFEGQNPPPDLLMAFEVLISARLGEAEKRASDDAAYQQACAIVGPTIRIRATEGPDAGAIFIARRAVALHRIRCKTAVLADQNWEPNPEDFQTHLNNTWQAPAPAPAPTPRRRFFV